MSDFIYDWTALPVGKSDSTPLTGLANQNLVAAEWNSTCQALLDLRNIAVGQGVSVKSFGAGNGNAAQDLAAFQAAITVANVASKHVHIPAGTYHFDMTASVGGSDACLFNLASNFTITGEGASSILWMENLDGTPDGDYGRNLFGIPEGSKNVVLRDFHVIGQNGVDGVGFVFVEQNGSSAINFALSTPSTGCKIINCLFENLFGFSIHAQGYANQCQILNCTMRWCSNGFNVNGHGNNQSFNTLYKSEGFECTGSNNTFVGNYLLDCFKTGFSIGGDQTVGTINHGCTLINNIVDGIENPGSPNTGIGILLNEATAYACVIGNQIRRTSGYGICSSTSMPGGYIKGHLIANNMVVNCSSGSPYVCGISCAASKSRITGNTVMNVEQNPAGGQYSDETGFVMQIGVAVTANDCVVDNNILGGTNYGLHFGNGTTGNVHYNNQYPQSTYRVSFEGTAAQSPDKVIGKDASTVVCEHWDGTGTFSYFARQMGGRMDWGSGAASLDTNLYRSAANVLKTDDAFVAMGGIIDGSGAYVNVKAYGAVGDGVADDTNAIEAALEVANGVTPGTWESGSDIYDGNPKPRNRKPVFFPPGIYKTTRTIPIRFKGVVIMGAYNGNSGIYEGSSARVYGDHNNDVFGVNATYSVNGFTIKDLQIAKRNAYIGLGYGISVLGPNYVYGMTFDGVQVQFCNNGLHIVTQDLLDGTGGMAALRIVNSMFANNAGFGVYLRGHASISIVEGNQIVANSTGGLIAGLKGGIVRNNLLEGQPQPLSITNGTASTDVVIEGNYFEETVDNASTVACIWLGLVRGFTVRNNMYSGAQNGLPFVGASACEDGSFDLPALLVGCNNVVVPYLVMNEQTAAVYNESVAYNLSRVSLPETSGPELGAWSSLVGGGAGDYTKIVGEMRDATLVDGVYRVLFSGLGTVPNGQYQTFYIPIKYTSEVPHGSTQFILIGSVLGVPDTRQAWGTEQCSTVVVGDTVLYVIRWKNTLGNDVTSCGLYVYPYGSDATIGSGAKICVFPQWIGAGQASVRPVNPLKLLPAGGPVIPSSGTWVVGDRCPNTAPVAGGSSGWVCTGAGTPGTWRESGFISLT